MARCVVRVVVTALFLSAPVAAAAQSPPGGLHPELRTDVIVGSATTTEVAAGAVVPAGDYLQLGGDVGVGVVTGDGRSVRVGSRIDAFGRFQLDTSVSRWGPYLAGGISYQADVGRRGALYLLATIGVHAPAVGKIAPALEVGLGGGIRAGLVLTWPGR